MVSTRSTQDGRGLLLWSGLAAGVALAGCASGFTHATARFADISAAAEQAFLPEEGTAADLCRREQRLSFLRSRVDGTWTAQPTAMEAYLVAASGSGHAGVEVETAAACVLREADGDAYRDALHLLAGFAAGLESLAASGYYDSNDLGDAAKSMGGLAKHLKAPGMVSDVLANMGDGLKWMADFAVRKYTEHEVREHLTEAATVMSKVYDLLDAYLRLNQAKLREVRTTLRGAASILQDRMKLAAGGQSDPAAAVEFVQFSARWYDELATIERRQELCHHVLDDVRGAMQQLTVVANTQKSDERDAAQRKLDEAAVDIARRLGQLGATAAWRR